jgi:hypothetical protein
METVCPVVTTQGSVRVLHECRRRIQNVWAAVAIQIANGDRRMLKI